MSMSFLQIIISEILLVIITPGHNNVTMIMNKTTLLVTLTVQYDI